MASIPLIMERLKLSCEKSTCPVAVVSAGRKLENSSKNCCAEASSSTLLPSGSRLSSVSSLAFLRLSRSALAISPAVTDMFESMSLLVPLAAPSTVFVSSLPAPSRANCSCVLSFLCAAIWSSVSKTKGFLAPCFERASIARLKSHVMLMPLGSELPPNDASSSISKTKSGSDDFFFCFVWSCSSSLPKTSSSDSIVIISSFFIRGRESGPETFLPFCDDFFFFAIDQIADYFKVGDSPRHTVLS
mmetsp:Transcript_60131/g.82402  ORF Transcript_60131/g.82402 Transcript_60131/m.82402 type:complete len:245 (-) Transcript_60131:101-835(-)